MPSQEGITLSSQEGITLSSQEGIKDASLSSTTLSSQEGINASLSSTPSPSSPQSPTFAVLVLVNPGAESPPFALTVPDAPKPSHLLGPHSSNPHYEDDLRVDAGGIDPKTAAKARSMAKKRQQGTKFSEMNAFFAGAADRE